jgi:hypothetical protein
VCGHHWSRVDRRALLFAWLGAEPSEENALSLARAFPDIRILHATRRPEVMVLRLILFVFSGANSCKFCLKVLARAEYTARQEI